MTTTTPTPALADLDLQHPIKDTQEAREYVDAWHRENFPTDRTFSRYILGTQGDRSKLAGDFAWQLANALARRAAQPVAPSPQIAEVAELPPLPRKIGTIYPGNYWTASDQAAPPGTGIAEVITVGQALQWGRAIAASRRASTDSQEPVLKFAIEVEKMLCRALGRSWSASGISIETLIAELAERSAHPSAPTADTPGGRAISHGAHRRIWKE